MSACAVLAANAEKSGIFARWKILVEDLTTGFAGEKTFLRSGGAEGNVLMQDSNLDAETRGEVFEMAARATMTPVELNIGDVCRFRLMNGETRTVEYVGGSSSVLEIPATEGLVATFTMRLKIDGVEIPFRRYLATQESFYEPAVVNGLRIFPDSTLEYLTQTVPMRYPSAGCQRHHPWKDCRIVLQDATLPLCPEKLHPWFVDSRIDALFIPIGDAYHGGNCWLGPFAYGEAHGGLDIRMRKGELLYAPFACDDQFMPLWANRNRGATSRWRGNRRWPDGTLWSINTSHVIDAVVAEHTAIANGQPYCTAAGTAIGEFEHTHFELHIHRDLNPPMPDWDAGFGQALDVKNDCACGQPEFYNVDPWMIFWQTFVQLRDAKGDDVAGIAPFQPARTGIPVRFRSARPIPAGLTGVWTFNDGSMHVGESVEHVFAHPGAYVITLTLTDFVSRRMRDTAIITVSGEVAADSALPGVRADEVSFVELKPGDLPAWGEKIHHDPFIVRRESDLVFFSRKDGQALPVRCTDCSRIAQGVEHRVYSCEDGECVEVFVRTPPSGPRKLMQADAEIGLSFGNQVCFKTPCFWVQHQFHGKRRWYDVNGGRSESGQFIRFTPSLRAGKWKVSATYAAPHQPGASYWVKVRAVDGIHRVRFEPLKNLTIGSFEFAEGNEGYVQIEAGDSVGQIAVASLKFVCERLDALSWVSESEERELRAEKARLEAGIRARFRVAKADPAKFKADDWVSATKVLPGLLGYPDGLQFYRKLTGIMESGEKIAGSKAAWREINDWIFSCCWDGAAHQKWVEFLGTRDFESHARTELEKENEADTSRLLEINTVLGLP